MTQAAPASIPTPPHFPVKWVHPDQARGFWQQERMHFPEPVSSLMESLEVKVLYEGANKGIEQYKMPISFNATTFNRYVYQDIAPKSHDPAVLERMGKEAEGALQPGIIGLAKTWSDQVLPELKRNWEAYRALDLSKMTDAQLAEHLQWVVERRAREWRLHFVIAFPMILGLGLFEHVYHQMLPTKDEFEPFVLLQGLPNKTLEGNIALWNVSREAKKSPAVLAALKQNSPEAVYADLGKSKEGQAFLAKFKAFLDVYGWRGDSWYIDDRSWVVYPRAPLTSLKSYVDQPDSDSPEALQQRMASEREVAVARSLNRLASHPKEAQGQFMGMLKAAQTCNVLQEDHNFWIDQTLQHYARRSFVEAGRRLTAQGRLAEADDIIHLTESESRDAMRNKQDYRQTVATRKAELEKWRKVAPPPVLGTMPPPHPPGYQPNPMEMTIMRFFGGPPKQSTATLVRGNPASKGKVTGYARVVRGLSEAKDLKIGEVLVCPTTSPPWTPFFRVASAVVTDTGGILSHCAIVAREFGIPAIVGTTVGTSTIKTGQRIIVDGAAGTIEILG